MQFHGHDIQVHCHRGRWVALLDGGELRQDYDSQQDAVDAAVVQAVAADVAAKTLGREREPAGGLKKTK